MPPQTPIAPRLLSLQALRYALMRVSFAESTFEKKQSLADITQGFAVLIDLSQLVFNVSCEVYLAGERIEYAVDGYGCIESCDLAVLGEIKRDIRAA